MAEYILKNYVNDSGKDFLVDWLKSLDAISVKRILLRLERLKGGNFGDYKQLSEHLYELRFSFGSGYRIYYTIEDKTIILLINGGDKKSQVKDIKLAKEIITELKGIQNGKY